MSISPNISAVLGRHAIKILKDLQTLYGIQAGYEELNPKAHGLFGINILNEARTGSIQLPNAMVEEGKPILLQIAQYWDFKNITNPVFAKYRYALEWHVEREYDPPLKGNLFQEATKDDHFGYSGIVLKRNIRFDWHPEIVTDHTEDSIDLLPHWHPNGCAKMRLPTQRLVDPIAVAMYGSFLFARNSWDQFPYDTQKRTFDPAEQLTRDSAMKKIGEEMAARPIRQETGPYG